MKSVSQNDLENWFHRDSHYPRVRLAPEKARRIDPRVVYGKIWQKLGESMAAPFSRALIFCGVRLEVFHFSLFLFSLCCLFAASRPSRSSRGLDHLFSRS